MLQHELALFLDGSGSETNPISSSNSTPRWQVQLAAAKAFAIRLQESDDAAAAAAAASGEAEKEGGGLLTFMFSSRGRERALGDINPGNFAMKTAGLAPGGHTYIMPAVALWQQARDEEFSADEQNDINREYDLLVATDGALNDEDQFLSWITSTGPNVKVFFLIVGHGPDNETAVSDYTRIANQSNGKVTVYDTRTVTDPDELAKKMASAIS